MTFGMKLKLPKEDFDLEKETTKKPRKTKFDKSKLLPQNVIQKKKMLLDVEGEMQFYVYDKNKREQKQMEEQYKPIELIMKQLNQKQNAFHDNKCFFLQAGTGAGKSSFFINALLLNCNGKRIYCTQPKVLQVLTSEQQFSVHYPAWLQQINIGSIIGGENREATNAQSITFMTTQILSIMIMTNSEKLLECRYICIDEVHELSSQMIQVLYFVKQFIIAYKDDKNCPTFIFMSATMNLERLMKYYGVIPKWTDVALLESQISKFNVEKYEFINGTTIQERFREAFEFVLEYYDEHKIYENPQRDILIFTKGMAHMKILQKILEEMNEKIKFPIIAFVFTSIENVDKNTEGYKHHNSDTPGLVKIYLTTDVAESGITFPRAFCGIDLGIHHKPVLQNFCGKQSFVVFPISESSKIQRRGRFGRVGPGMYITLFSNKLKLEKEDLSPMVIESRLITYIFTFLQQQIPLDIGLFENIQLDIQGIKLYERLGSDVMVKAVYDLMRYGLMYRDFQPTYIMKLLLNQKTFDDYICVLGKFFGCSLIEIYVISYIFQYGMDLSEDERKIRRGAPTQLKEYFLLIMSEQFHKLKFARFVPLVDNFQYWAQNHVIEQVPYQADGWEKLLQMLDKY